MGDDLGEEWWKHESDSDSSQLEEKSEKDPSGKPPSKAEKRKKVTEKAEIAAKRKKNEQTIKTTGADCEMSTKSPKKRKRKKKTISDVLASSDPKPASPPDLQNLIAQHFSDKRSVIEMEELKLPDSCFLSSNDLTHSLSSYLKHVCPKWAKIQKQHTEKSSVVLLIACSSALRTIELIKQLTTFKGEAKTVKLFAKHIKIEEQVKLLQKGISHIGVGTPGRINALIEKEGLNLQSLRYVILDWNWRDQKLRRMMDIPEVRVDLMRLLENGVIKGCQTESKQVKIGLF